ncbi:MAG: type II toxin-antitoxin system RelE/ParE family toxin [Acidobacteriota bacterium]|nr:type II toxin-antitoxin system RelE/ParE family toxin [Acidobacteriota bacterium]
MTRLVARTFEAAEIMGRYPSAGHPGCVPAIRELSVADTPFIIAYRPIQDEIQILAVVHLARRWPVKFGEKG